MIGINPMVSISTFGWFAATAIAVNYLLVTTFTPAVLVCDEVGGAVLFVVCVVVCSRKEWYSIAFAYTDVCEAVLSGVL